MSKKIEVQVSELRNSEIEMARLQTNNANFDQSYHFFYDETNNARRLRIKGEKFNFELNKNFVLGGLAFIGNPPDLSVIKNKIALQDSANEIKFKHVAKGSFDVCLKSSKLEIFLQTILNTENLYIHYHHLDFLYWSLVDIVDSVLSDNMSEWRMELKNALYIVAKKEINHIQSLLVNSKYPDIDYEEIPHFINFLVEILSNYRENNDFGDWVKILIAELEYKKSSGERLEFIMDEEQYELLKDFHILYLRPLRLFINSEHIFDNETSVSSILENYKILNGDKEIQNYKFVDSQCDLFVQLSDVFVGIVGKYIEFLNNKERECLKSFIEGLNEQQVRNLKLLYDLEIKSDNHNQVLLHHTAPLDILSKGSFMSNEFKRRYS